MRPLLLNLTQIFPLFILFFGLLKFTLNLLPEDLSNQVAEAFKIIIFYQENRSTHARTGEIEIAGVVK